MKFSLRRVTFSGIQPFYKVQQISYFLKNEIILSYILITLYINKYRGNTMKSGYWDAMRKKIRSNQAVSEVIGVVLLLGITMCLFAVLNFTVFHFSFEPSVTSVNLIGTIDKAQTYDNITIEHDGGESLDGNIQIMITIGYSTTPILRNVSDLLNDLNGDNKWNFGEIIEFPNHTKGQYIQVSVMDPVKNTILLSVVLQQG